MFVALDGDTGISGGAGGGGVGHRSAFRIEMMVGALDLRAQQEVVPCAGHLPLDGLRASSPI
jgi:hypothetical protein